jgi:hypothetical protein
MEFKEELLGRICRLCGITDLKREISYLKNLNGNEETAYKNMWGVATYRPWFYVSINRTIVKVHLSLLGSFS